LAASKELLSTDDAVAGFPWESSVSAAIEADGARMG
jgi:hypothetical protein